MGGTRPEEFSQDQIDDAKRVSILELIGRDYPMVKDGTHWWRCDPKHVGEGKSLTCNTQSNLFTWWSNNEKGGDTLRWMMKYAREAPMSFPDAMRFLLAWNGSTLTAPTVKPAQSPKPKTIPPSLVEFYHDCLDAAGYRWWNGRGVPDAYIDDLKLGATRHAYTIPVRNVFTAHRTIANIKYRNAGTGTPRYWQEEAQGVQLYVPHMEVLRYPYLCWAGGEIKSMVLSLNGIMCASSTGGIDTWMPEWGLFLKEKTIILLPDPGEEEQAERLIEKMVHDVSSSVFRVVHLPHDPDDCLTTQGMSVPALRHLIGI